MENPYRRKKQPELVREQIMVAAVEVAAERGGEILSLGEVARRAGVTKGGLLHHFPSKHILIEAMYDHVLSRFENKLDELMAKDPRPEGRFTRAYVKVTAIINDDCLNSRIVGAASLAMGANADLCEKWNRWIKVKLKQSGEDVHSAAGRMIRFAADGIWLESCFANPLESKGRAEVVKRLLEMSYSI
jgi:Transcriptional regulator